MPLELDIHYQRNRSDEQDTFDDGSEERGKTRDRFENQVPDLLDAQQVAHRLRISVSQAYCLMHGELGAVHIGRSIRVPRQRFDEYLAGLEEASDVA